MPRIKLNLLGTFQLVVDGEPRDGFRSDKARALLAYLVLEADRPVRRLQLANLFWEGYQQFSALASVRVALANLRELFAPFDLFKVTRHTIQFQAAHPDFWCDALELSKLATGDENTRHPDRLPRASHFTSDELLPGFEGIEGAAFQAWLQEHRTYYRKVAATLASAQRTSPLPPVLPAPASAAGAEVLALVASVPAVESFYGRQAELQQLTNWLGAQRCRLVSILGMGGQGKTALAARLVRTLAASGETAADRQPFVAILWRSLLNAPPLSEVMQGWLEALSGHQAEGLPASLDRQLDRLLAFLQRYRCLLVLDNLESILATGELAGHYRAGYEEYGQLLQRVGEVGHRSCLLITSREEPYGWKSLELGTPAIRSLRLGGLAVPDGHAMLQSFGLTGDAGANAAIIQRYAGNPLALKLVTSTIQEIFAGNAQAFLTEETLVFDDIRDVLDQHFDRLSALEGEVMTWLAIEREPVSFPALCANLVQAPPPRTVLEAIRSLQRRSLVEHTGEQIGLQNVIIEYATARLVAALCQELADFRLVLDERAAPAPPPAGRAALPQTHLNRFALVKAQAKESIRASQARLLLRPVADWMMARWGKPVAAQHLRQLVRQFQQTCPLAPGYAAANLLHLLLHMEVDLRGADFSQLALRQADLSRARLTDLNLAQSDLTGSVFMAPLSDVYTLAFTPDSEVLVVGTGAGALKLWRLADRQLLADVYAYPDKIRALRLSADGKLLATAGQTGEVRLWAVAAERTELQPRHLVTPKTTEGCLALSPDGSSVATADEAYTVHLWDSTTGEEYARLAGHTGRLRTLAISPDGQWLATGGQDCTVRLWDLAARPQEGGEEHTAAATLTGHTNAVLTVAFSPDGRLLASGSDDWEIRIWEVATAKLVHVLHGHSTSVYSLAFSPDGKRLASGSNGGTVRWWDVDSGELLSSAKRHQHLVWALAFSPDGHLLASGSADQTVCLWEADGGALLYTLHGYPKAVRALALSSDGRVLASAGDDQQIHLWDVADHTDATPLRTLAGHAQWIKTVAFSPDGRLLASAGNDRRIYLWEIGDGAAHEPVRTLYGHEGLIVKLCFHPNGKLLASCSYDKSVRLWDVETGKLLHVLRGHQRIVWSISFSADGQHLFSTSSDETVCVWELSALEETAISTPGRRSERLGGEVLTSVCSPDDQFLIVNTAGTLHLLDHHAHVLQTFETNQQWIWDTALSADGTTLVTVSIDLTAQVWAVPAGRLRQSLAGHREEPVAVAVSADGATVYTGSLDGAIIVWDAATGEKQQTLQVDAPYAGMDITGTTGLSAAQRVALKALGAVESTVAFAIQRAGENQATLVTDRPRNAPAQRALIDDSLQYLSAQTARVLARCAVFEEGFSAEAATVVAGATPGQLQQLVEHGLLQQMAPGRFGMPEPVRQFAAGQLAAAPEEELWARNRHCDHFADLLDHWEKSPARDESPYIQMMRIELANLSAAFRWAIRTARRGALALSLPGLARLYALVGLTREAETLFAHAILRLRALVVEQGGGDPDLRRLLAQLLLEQAYCCVAATRLEEARQQSQEALRLAQQLGDIALSAAGHKRLADVAWAQGDYHAHRLLIEKSVAFARSGHLKALEVSYLLNLGMNHRAQGDPTAAIACYHEALQLAQQARDRETENMIYNNVGVSYTVLGEFEQALHYYRQSLALSGELGDQEGISFAHLNLGILLEALGDYEQAQRDTEDSLGLFRLIGNRRLETKTLAFQGCLWHRLGDDQRAYRNCQQALQLAEAAGLRAVQAEALTYFGHTLAGLQRLDEAAAAYASAFALRQEMGRTAPALVAQAGLADTLLRQSKQAQAQTEVEAMLATLAGVEMNAAQEPGFVWLTCYRVLAANQDVRAGEVLENATHWLQTRAATIADEHLRATFLQRVASHREILDLAQMQ